MIEISLLILSLLLVLACGVFVAAEFALVSLNRSAVERLAKHGDEQAEGVLDALKTLSLQLSGAQVGITITNLGIGFLAEPAISELLRGPLASVGVPDGGITSLSILLGVAIATAITMIFGELVPKNLALAHPIGTAKVVEKPLRYFTWLIKYPIRILNGSANYILRKFGIDAPDELMSARSADELLSLVRRSAEKGTLPKETAAMLERSLNFGEHTASDVMTPRVRVYAIAATQPVSDIFDLARNSGLSRFPVYGEDLDDVVGVVHIKHAITVPHNTRQSVTAGEIMLPPVVVPSSIQLEPLLDALRKGGLQMAVVIDEFGGTDGIVTIEDLLEELVGEVRDEHDRSRAAIRANGENSWLLSGLLRPDEIGEKLGIFLPEEDDFETIAGLVTDRLEHIPVRHESVMIKAINREGIVQHTVLTVQKMDGRRIDILEMHIREAPDEEQL